MDVISKLVLSTNPPGTIANSVLDLASLVLPEAHLPEAVPEARVAAPRLGSDNMPTVSWSTLEYSAINPVVVDLLCIHALHSRKFFLNTSIFYHPGQENCMIDDASHLFYLYDTVFLTHVSVVHPQSHGLWHISLLPSELLSCVVSALRRKP